MLCVNVPTPTHTEDTLPLLVFNEITGVTREREHTPILGYSHAPRHGPTVGP